MKQLFFVLLVLILLTSCGHYSDGTSVWAGGLGVIPIVLIVGSFYFFVLSYIASKSNSTKQDKINGRVLDNTGNVPIYKVGKFWFGVALFVATVVVIIMVNADK